MKRNCFREATRMNPPEANQAVHGSLDQTNSKPECPNSTGHGISRPAILLVLNTYCANGKQAGPGHRVPLMLLPLCGVEWSDCCRRKQRRELALHQKQITVKPSQNLPVSCAFRLKSLGHYSETKGKVYRQKPRSLRDLPLLL